LGRKVHPYGFRLGVIRDWKSHWYAEGEEYADLLHEDLNIRKYIRDTMGRAGISRIEIERSPRQVSVTIWTARPGIVIGRKGSAVKGLRDDLKEMTGKKVSVDVQEIEQPDLDAKLVAENVASQLERRISHNRAMKRAIQAAMRAGAHGAKVMCKGRLYGAEMARSQEMPVRCRNGSLAGDARGTSTETDATCRYRLCPGGGAYHVWSHWSESMDLQR
jgi:small subunit ribosomal protein S3